MERVEDLQLGGLKILRRDDLPGYTTDSVLLADFAGGLRGKNVCDLGTGTGIIPLLLLGRRPELCVTGIEIEPELAALAQRSAALNGLESTLRIVQGDLRQVDALLPAASFDAVICNPPYHADAQGGPHSHQRFCTERDVARAAARLLRPRGRLYLCCPAERMFVFSSALQQAGIEPKRARLVASLPGRAPYLCLMEGALGARGGCRVETPLILMEAPGKPGSEYKAIYHMEEDSQA